jgi:hypothetical protein
MTDTEPLAPLEIRVGTKQAAKFLGVSVRQVQSFVADGSLAALDMRGANARRPHWTIAMSSIRLFITSRDPEKATQGTQSPQGPHTK